MHYPRLNTTVDISQTVPDPVDAEAFGVAPAATVASSASRSMSLAPVIRVRSVNPLPAAGVVPKPESA